MLINARIFLLGLLCLFGTTCFFGCHSALKEKASCPEEALYPIRFSYPTFHDDKGFDSLEEVLKRNLVYLNRVDKKAVFQYGPHKFTCEQVRKSQEAFLKLITESHDWEQLNKKIKKQFSVYRAAGRVGNKAVLFTGYYEPVFDGSLTRDDTFKYPLYKMPDDLVKVDLSLFSERFKGQRITARIEGNKVLPYYTRQQIDIEKMLDGKGQEIAWMRDPLDVFFLHIQGSGRLNLPDGTNMRVGYKASNGRPYRSIGKYMLNKNLIPKEGMSMQAIREYLGERPDERDEVLSHNPSYVFFRELTGEPLGNISVPLVPERSLALDSRLFPKGALAFITCQKPTIDDEGKITEWNQFSRFVLNQDTGGAIKGAGRADLFWGSGPYAEVAAGHMKHEGELYILIKKDR
jgi:membrane-bound lytic murein transglycosylase A